MEEKHKGHFLRALSQLTSWQKQQPSSKLPKSWSEKTSNLYTSSFLHTDFISDISGLQNPRKHMERHTYSLLCELSQHTQVTVQWIPAHCGLAGNDDANRLVKEGSRKEEHKLSICYWELNTLVRSFFQRRFKETHSSKPEDEIHSFTRQQQTIFRLRTGHCTLRANMYRIGLSSTPESVQNSLTDPKEHPANQPNSPTIKSQALAR